MDTSFAKWLKNRSLKRLPYCVACGDLCVIEDEEHKPGIIEGKPYCWECYQELKYGKISKKPAQTHSGGRSPGHSTPASIRPEEIGKHWLRHLTGEED